MGTSWYRRRGYQGNEKRRKPDWVKRAAGICGVTGWITMVLGVAIFFESVPQSYGYFNVFYGAGALGWERGKLFLSLGMLVVALALSIMGITCNLKRLKRESDRLYKSIIVLSIISIICVCYVLTVSGGVLFG